METGFDSTIANLLSYCRASKRTKDERCDPVRNENVPLHVEPVLRKLIAYCRENDWSGYEPYDALNSRLFSSLPFLNSRVPRLILTQGLKRSPINFRRSLLVPKTQNPKAIALFLCAFLRLSASGVINTDADIELMIKRLIALRSVGVSYWCWGYSFPWQTRTVLVPRWEPNLVCTAFAANALLDAYEQHHYIPGLTMAVSAAEYFLKELYWSEGASLAGFAYPLPTVRNQVHNANLLAASVLCRVYKHTGDNKLLGPAVKVARYSAAQQKDDGSWDYGESRSQRWVDNFHTGFNLSALLTIARALETREFDPHMRRGFEFYRAHFFREDGAVGYYHNRFYPIDTHCAAQSIITLLEFKHLDSGNLALAFKVFQWAHDHMWNDKGFFYFRVLRSCTNRISYLRWTQAWMLLALTMLRCESNDEAVPSQHQQATCSAL